MMVGKAILVYGIGPVWHCTCAHVIVHLLALYLHGVAPVHHFTNRLLGNLVLLLGSFVADTPQHTSRIEALWLTHSSPLAA